MLFGILFATIMLSIDSLIADFPYSNGDIDLAIAAHSIVYIGLAAPATGTKQKASNLTKPTVLGESSEETWNAFHARWRRLKNDTPVTPNESTQ